MGSSESGSMAGREMVLAFGVGVVLWFFSALYFGIIVEAAFPQRAEYLRDMASASFFPMALIGTLVLVRQGLLASTLRFVAALAGGGLLWFPLAALLGSWLVATRPQESVQGLLPALNVLALVVSFGLAWWVTRWLSFPSSDGGPGGDGNPSRPSSSSSRGVHA